MAPKSLEWLYVQRMEASMGRLAEAPETPASIRVSLWVTELDVLGPQRRRVVRILSL